MAKELTDIVNELIDKKYEFKALYCSRTNNNYFSESTNLNISSKNINKILPQYIEKGYKYFGIVLVSGFNKYYFISLDTENKKIKLPELHYENNQDIYKRLADIFKENEWKVDLSKSK